MSHYFASVHSLSTIEPRRLCLAEKVVGHIFSTWWLVALSPIDRLTNSKEKFIKISCPLELELAVGGYRFPRSPMSKVSFCQKQQECKECKERLMNLFLVNFLLWNNPSLDFMLFAQILKNHNPPFLSFNGSNLKVLWRTEGYLTPTGAWLF